jgi:hypothetical protein
MEGLAITVEVPDALLDACLEERGCDERQRDAPDGHGAHFTSGDGLLHKVDLRENSMLKETSLGLIRLS